MSLNFELTVPTSSASRGLGNGTFDENLSVQIQKAWKGSTIFASAGCTITGSPHMDGMTVPRKNSWFAGCAQETRITEKVKHLSELYLETSDTPGERNTFEGGIGLAYEVTENFKIHCIIARSLRDGPPDTRGYIRFEWDFDAPWKKSTRE